MNGGLAAWLQRHRRSILFLMGVLAAGGLIAALNMPVSLFPAIQFPRVRVSIDAGDRPASQMAIAVTRPVEQGRARRVAVRTGIEQDGWIGVQGALRVGRRVVIAGNYELHDGMAVRVGAGPAR